MNKEIRYKHLNKEWVEICKQMQALQRRRVEIYKEAEELKPGNAILKVERAPSIYFDLNQHDIDQFKNERI
jgi:hypothetical protein